MNLVRRLSAVVASAAALLSIASSDANAASIIKNPNPPDYKVEIEPKFNLGFLGAWDYGGNFYGPGVRFSIPVMSPGFIKKLNNSVAITFGADFVYYEGYANYYRRWCGNNRNCWDYYAGYNYGFWLLHLPVAMQWNFFLTEKWSVFGEPGITLRYAFYKDINCNPAYGICEDRKRLDPFFTFYAGGRFHFSDKVALTMRIGHPIEASVGVSFFL
jgi:hypothetical protein